MEAKHRVKIESAPYNTSFRISTDLRTLSKAPSKYIAIRNSFFVTFRAWEIKHRRKKT